MFCFFYGVVVWVVGEYFCLVCDGCCGDYAVAHGRVLVFAFEEACLFGDCLG